MNLLHYYLKHKKSCKYFDHIPLVLHKIHTQYFKFDHKLCHISAQTLLHFHHNT